MTKITVIKLTIKLEHYDTALTNITFISVTLGNESQLSFNLKFSIHNTILCVTGSLQPLEVLYNVAFKNTLIFKFTWQKQVYFLIYDSLIKLIIYLLDAF
jgi:hypothetical protein